jgi:exosortase
MEIMSAEDEKTNPSLIQGLWPHEIAFLALFVAAVYCSQYHTETWPAYVFGAAMLAALPVLWFRCRAEWGRLPNRGFFLGLTLIWVLLFAFLGISTFQILHSPSLFGWMFNVYSSPMVDEQHGMLIPFVVLALIWWKREELGSQATGLWWPGIWLVAGGLFLHLTGYIVQQPRLSIIGFFTGLYGLMGVAWGARWLKAIFFPYFLLIFCVPLGELGAPITMPLRILVASIVATISQLGLAPDVMRQGTQLFDAQHTFAYEVAPACSGIRSVVAMLALTTIYGFTTFKPMWKRLLMIGAAIPIAIFGNVVRLCFTVTVAELFGQDAGKAVETKFGFITFAVAIGCVFLLGRWLEKSEIKTDAGVKPSHP